MLLLHFCRPQNKYNTACFINLSDIFKAKLFGRINCEKASPNSCKFKYSSLDSPLFYLNGYQYRQKSALISNENAVTNQGNFFFDSIFNH